MEIPWLSKIRVEMEAKNLDILAVIPGPNMQYLTGLEFQPDFVWIKDRGGSQNHALFDSVRGVTKDIHSNVTDAEATDAQTLTAFDSDGFTVGTANYVNQNTNTFVGWNWKAGTGMCWLGI